MFTSGWISKPVLLIAHQPSDMVETESESSEIKEILSAKKKKKLGKKKFSKIIFLGSSKNFLFENVGKSGNTFHQFEKK